MTDVARSCGGSPQSELRARGTHFHRPLPPSRHAPLAGCCGVTPQSAVDILTQSNQDLASER
jgi:hypothetical protein